MTDPLEWGRRSIRRLSSRLGFEPDTGTTTELNRACSMLGWTVDAREVERTATLTTAGIAVLGSVATVVGLRLGGPLATPLGLLLSMALGLACGAVVRRAPLVGAAIVRTRAVADAAGVVSALALSLRLSPVPERAVQFASESGTGPLHDSLRAHADRAAVSGRADAGIEAFAAEWTAWFPALDRAAALLTAAAGAEAGEDRDRLLDRAVTAVESDLRDRAASFAGDLRGPVTGLYAFGVLLPLALVGTLPAAAAAGVNVPGSALVAVYDVLLPLALVVAGGRLLLRRPVAFPSPRVPASHPDVDDWRPHAVGVGLAAGAVGWSVAGPLVGGWAAPLVAGGLGVGGGIAVWLHPVRAVQRTVDERERGLPDVLALVGRSVADGDSVERTLPQVAATASGPVGDALDSAARRRAALGTTVETAFTGIGGPFGPNAAVGPRTEGTVAALSAAVEHGRPAGATLTAHADRLAELDECERAARRELASVTNTLRDTAALFGPLVGGAAVALASRLTATDLESTGAAGGSIGGLGSVASETGPDAAATALSVSVVGPTVGGYVLVLAVVLTALATGLERGFDATLVGYRVGIALATATGAFVVGHVVVALLVG